MDNFETLLECIKVMKPSESRMTSQSLKEAKISQRSVDKYLSYIPDSYEVSEEEKLSIAKELAYRAVNGVELPKPYNSKYANSLGFGYYNKFNDLTDEEKIDVISRFKPSTLSKWKGKVTESMKSAFTESEDTEKFTQEEIDKVNQFLSEVDPEYFRPDPYTALPLDSVEVTMLNSGRLMELPAWYQGATPNLIKYSDGKVRDIEPYGKVYDNIDAFLNSERLQDVLKYHSKSESVMTESSMSRSEMIDWIEDNWNTNEGYEQLGAAIDAIGYDSENLDDSDESEGFYANFSDDDLENIISVLKTGKVKKGAYMTDSRAKEVFKLALDNLGRTTEVDKGTSSALAMYRVMVDGKEYQVQIYKMN